MTNIAISKRHGGMKYHYFHIVSFSVLFPIWLQIIFLSQYTNIELALSLSGIFLGIYMVSVAVSVKYFKNKSLIIQKLLLYCGVILQLITLLISVKILMADYKISAFIIIFISILLSMFWIMLYRVETTGLDAEIKERLIKANKLKLIVLAVLLYGVDIIIGRSYYANVKKLLDMPFSPSIEAMINNKVVEVKLLIVLAAVVYYGVFFVSYKITWNRLSEKPN